MTHPPSLRRAGQRAADGTGTFIARLVTGLLAVLGYIGRYAFDYITNGVTGFLFA